MASEQQRPRERCDSSPPLSNQCLSCSSIFFMILGVVGVILLIIGIVLAAQGLSASGIVNIILGATCFLWFTMSLCYAQRKVQDVGQEPDPSPPETSNNILYCNSSFVPSDPPPSYEASIASSPPYSYVSNDWNHGVSQNSELKSVNQYGHVPKVAPCGHVHVVCQHYTACNAEQPGYLDNANQCRIPSQGEPLGNVYHVNSGDPHDNIHIAPHGRVFCVNGYNNTFNADPSSNTHNIINQNRNASATDQCDNTDGITSLV